MRALVRTLGSLLIGFGAFLWLYAAKIAPSNQPVVPVATLPAVKPAPPPSKSHHHNETAESKASTPVPLIEAPIHPPVSKAVLNIVNGYQHRFTVDLHKEDGWFDTGIPVTADVEVFSFCLSDVAGAPDCTGWVEAMIGGIGFHPISTNGARPTIDVITLPPGQDSTPYQLGPGIQYLHMTVQALQTLKLKITADANAPDELHKVMVKINVRPVDPNQPQQISTPQQRELAELAKWVKQ